MYWFFPYMVCMGLLHVLGHFRGKNTIFTTKTQLYSSKTTENAHNTVLQIVLQSWSEYKPLFIL